MAASKKIPFDFVFDYLHNVPLRVKPMFGCHAVYSGEKILLILRKKTGHPEANGIWFATEKEHHPGLKKTFPSMQSVYILSEGKAETSWQMIHEEAEDFEESAIKLCEIILKRDERIGRVPGKKPAKKQTTQKPRN